MNLKVNVKSIAKEEIYHNREINTDHVPDYKSEIQKLKIIVKEQKVQNDYKDSQIMKITKE